jgi:flagellin
MYSYLAGAYSFETGGRGMAEVSISATMRTTLLELRRTGSVLDVAAQRLSTGLKVNSALDGNAAFFDASGLTSRAADLLTIKNGINEAATVVGGAVDAINSMITLLENIKVTINAAKSSTVSGAVATTSTGDTITDSSLIIKDVVSAVSGDSLDIIHDGTTTTVSISNTTTFDDLASTINGITGLTATVSDGNPIVITAADGQDINITNNVNDLATDLGLHTSTNGTLASSDARRSAETEFDLVRTQINSLVTDSSIHGSNLLSTAPDTLTIDLSDVSTSSLSVAGVTTNVTELSLTAVDANNSFALDAGITATVAEIDAAIATLTTTTANFGTHLEIIEARLNFNEEIINIAEEGAALLTQADADVEAADLLALQARHNLGITALGLSFTDGTAITELLKLGG